MASLWDLREMLDQLVTLNEQLRSQITEVDINLPSALGFSSSSPIARLSGPEARKMASDVFLDMDTPRPTHPGFQSVICASRATLDTASEINSLKDNIRSLIQIAKVRNRLNSRKFTQYFHRDPMIAGWLQTLGISQINLIKTYRHVPVFYNQPNVLTAISFGWSSGSRSATKLKPKEIIEMIETSHVQDDTKQYYHDVLSRAVKNKTVLFTSRRISLHQLMNARFEGKRAWQMSRTSLPVLVEGDRLPEIRFTAHPKASSDSSWDDRIKRSDSLFESANLLIPALNIYGREA